MTLSSRGRPTILVVRGHSFVGRKGFMVTVKYKEGDKEKYEVFPVIDLDMVVIVGKGVTMSTAALQLLGEQRVPVLFHGPDWHLVLLDPVQVGWAEARRKQYLMAESELGTSVAKEFIRGKLEGMANVAKNLSYKAKGSAPNADAWRKEGRGELVSCKNLDCVKKVEAEWSAKLWKDLTKFIPEMESRVPRKRDPPNRALDYVYALTYALCAHALVGAGLDPYAGLIHRERSGKISFVYDFSEMFKPAGIYVVATAARSYKLKLEGDFLDKGSLARVSQTFYTIFENKKYAVRKFIYTKAWELRNSLEKGTGFKAYIFKP